MITLLMNSTSLIKIIKKKLKQIKLENMELSFVRSFNSITELNTIEINDFSVLTGINGSGKTHLLQAIENGAIMIKDVELQEIVYYNYSDFNLYYNNDQTKTGERYQSSVEYLKKQFDEKVSLFQDKFRRERYRILGDFKLFPNESGHLFYSLFELGYNIKSSVWTNEEINECKKITENLDFRENPRKYYEALSDSAKVIFDFFGTIPENFEIHLQELIPLLPRYYANQYIVDSDYDTSLLDCNDTDLENYKKIITTNPTLIGEIWTPELADNFSQSFIDFIFIYRRFINNYPDYCDIGLLEFRTEILKLYDELEEKLTSHMDETTIRLIKAVNGGKSLFKDPKSESGFLDLNQITEEEKNYQIAKNRNEFNEFKSKQKEVNVHFYNDKEFLKRYGKSPVDLLNEALLLYDCNGYVFNKIESSDGYGLDPQNLNIELALYNKNKKFETNLGSLSSGEKTLLALTFFIYKLRLRNKVVARILLLDEIDSALHPSMSKRIMNVLYQLLHKEMGIKIIMSTHSPATVAFAPEESLLVMKDVGEDRIYHCNRDAALKALTVGVPSFSINYENRRQVFVESKYDVQYYESFYQIFETRLEPEISLNFIACGDVQIDKNGQPNNGCAIVKKVTKTLREATDDQFVWGIIDWDLEANLPECEYVKVLGWNDRYSIENYILDPLLMILYLLKKEFYPPSFFGLDDGLNVNDILYFTEKQLQQLIERIIEMINTEIKSDLNDMRSYYTVGGHKLKLPKDIMEFKGHKLENVYKKIFTEISGIGGRDNALKNDVIKEVFESFQDFVPKELLEILQAVQQE